MDQNQQNADLKKISSHIKSYFRKNKEQEHPYYNLKHTIDVVDKSLVIADHYQLNGHDSQVLETAAWFQAAGFLKEENDHEGEGAQLAEKFLVKLNANPDFITAVRYAILATKNPQSPADLVQQILCDVMYYDLGTDRFLKNMKLQRREWILLNNIKISKKRWQRDTAEFMESHSYYTDYCRIALADKKAENLKELKKRVQPVEGSNTVITELNAGNRVNQKPATKCRRNIQHERPDKGIETMFRISSGNHQRLSDMADKRRIS